MSVAGAVLLLQVASTLAMVGVIWFVQLVHYPLMAKVGSENFVAYEAAHMRRTSWVVIPLMLSEALTTGLLLGMPEVVPLREAGLGAALLAGVWASTFFLQVPLHGRLEQGFDEASHASLVRTNTLRTVLWTARGALVLAWLGHALS